MVQSKVVAGIAGLLAIVVPAVALGQGSNLGSYGAPFVPGGIAGSVTSGGAAVAGARVETTAGQFATTNARGEYVLYVDAPGVYDVSVSSGALAAGPVQVNVTMGAATTLNFGTLKVVPRPRRNLPRKPPAAAGPRP
jgi:hypothetical protein